ncbi:MAG: hypothetical protein JXJ19_01080 [Elusimicrobia bacterium]|nr:hypothetical protein [Elusimicrobiota bacterium]
MKEEKSKTGKIKVINSYLTPMALILVLMAVIFSQPLGASLYVSLVLLIASLGNNILLAAFSGRIPTLRKTRMIVNVVINILLVYTLVVYWGPVWYLFLLTPVATAVYSGRLKTFLVSLGMSALLALIYMVRGAGSAAEWGQILSKILLIIFISLFINELVNTDCT